MVNLAAIFFVYFKYFRYYYFGAGCIGAFLTMATIVNDQPDLFEVDQKGIALFKGFDYIVLSVIIFAAGGQHYFIF